MNNGITYLKLTTKRQEIEEQLDKMTEQVKEYRDTAKKFKKGSSERLELMDRANDILASEEYKILKAKMETFNFCINTVFYL